MKSYLTEQEQFWAGQFGEDYIERNQGTEILASKIAFWSQIVHSVGAISSCLELGSNIGLNLKALGILLPYLQMTGVEINSKAAEACAKLNRVKVVNASIFDYQSDELFDLTFTAGVLIHINPNMLPRVYDVLYQHTRRYILVAEYYSLTPMEVNYRGHEGKLFKRDFAGEIMEYCPQLNLRDYGFLYHRDKLSLGEDMTWFLMEKDWQEF